MPFYESPPSQVPQIMQGMHDAIEAQNEKYAKIRDNAKAADMFMKANPEALSSVGMSQEQWSTLGARDKAAAVQGLIQKQGFDKAAGAMQEQQAQIGLLQQHTKTLADALAEARSDRPKFAGLNADLATALAPPPPGAEGPTNELNADTLTRAAAGRGLIGNPNMDRFMNAMERVQAMRENSAARRGAGEGTPQFIEDPVTGSRKIILGKTMSESGVNPEKVQMGAIPQYDESSGELIGHSVPTASGKFTFKALTTPNAAQQQNADTQTVIESEKAIGLLDDKIHNWNGLKDAFTKDPETNPAPDPAVLKDLKDRRATQKRIYQRASSNLGAGGQGSGVRSQESGSAPPRPPAAPRIPTLPPPVGTVQGGYRYNGKFPPNDQRGWDKQ